MSQTNFQTVRVNLAARSYDVEIGAENLSHLRATLNAFPNVQHVVILTDANVAPLYAENIAEHLAAQDLAVDRMIIKPGEESKSIASAEYLWENLLKIGTDRQSVILAIGGGVVGDLAGFIAATYARGIRFFQLPTTLLAQVDSSVGGKVGVNLSGGKNMVGAFYQPLGVLIDTKTLDTLDESQYLAGLGEVVKYGVSLDAELFELLENNIDRITQRDHILLTKIVARCCRIKANIVEKDEFEMLGLRAKLNYGHTFAHAYETLSGYGTLLHGLAVAIGLVDAARLARKLNRVDNSFVERQIAINEQLGLPIQYDNIRAEEILDLMTHDKKSVRGSLRFILPTKLGQCELVTEISPEVVKEALCFVSP
ncbi:MAG: 3-dehydroquinate synthase [Planctomycetaceae bacterium]|nr:3-dehydroquinate synthase [Planctomycetaceae bacterium]